MNKLVYIVFDNYPPMMVDRTNKLSFTEPPIKGTFISIGSAVKFIKDNNMDGRWHFTIEEVKE